MNDLLIRVLTGVIGGGLVYGALTLSPWGIWLFSLFIAGLGFHEWCRMVGLSMHARPTLVAWLLLGFLWGGMGWAAQHNTIHWSHLGRTLVGFPLLTIVCLYERDVQNGVRYLLHLTLGMVYIVLPSVLYFLLCFVPVYDFRIALGVVLMFWMTDTGAYLFGRMFGRHWLFERLSPKKTWEGLAGGAVFGACFGLWFETLMPVDSLNWLVVAALTLTVGTYGDLAESLFKRHFAVKDSGTLLPGHGGVLDRFDSFLLALPLIYVYQQLWMG